jgi:4-aminobutyrate aminotransferase-like enzyme
MLIASGPTTPGQFMLPQPNSYRSIFRHIDGSYDWETELDYGWNHIDQASNGSLAACLVECIQGDGGIHVLPSGYLQALKRHCEKRGMLLIVDEAQTAFGRTGKLFAIDHDKVVPDIWTSSKPLANGLPLSAVVTSAEIDARCKTRGFLFFTTHTNEPLLTAIGNTVLNIVIKNDLAHNAKERGKELLAGLHKLQDLYSCIGDVRGRGLMAGIEIVSDRRTKAPNVDLARAFHDAMWERGLWCQLQGGMVFRIGPPINVKSEQISKGLEIMQSALSSVK